MQQIVFASLNIPQGKLLEFSVGKLIKSRLEKLTQASTVR